jgi:hypothetical protein
MKTKIKLLLAAICLFVTNVSQAQSGWSYSSPYIYTTTSTDNVGIGTNLPGYPLVVAPAIIAGTLSSGGHFKVGIMHNSYAAIGIQDSAGGKNVIFGTNEQISDILFANRTQSSSNFSERMRITHLGNVGIGTSSPDTSALLDVFSGHKGVLITQVALTDTTDGSTIALPATSLLVYNTGTGGLNPAGYWYNAGTSSLPHWVHLADSYAWSLIGNSGTTASTAAIGSTVNHNFVGTTDAQDWVMATNNLERARITSAGNIGIGTKTPQGKVEIVSGSDYNALTLANNVATGTANGGVITGKRKTQSNAPFSGFGSYDIGTNRLLYMGGGIWNHPDANTLTFFTAPTYTETNNTGVERMRITSAGYVGIGTLGPATLTHIYSPSDYPILRVEAGTANGGTLSLKSNIGEYQAYLQGIDLRFSDGTDRVTFKNGGNVGIGTTSPATHAGYTTLALNNTTNGGVIDFMNNGTLTGQVYNSATSFNVYATTSIPLIFSAGGTPRMRILSTGEVGIGTTSPANKLDVAGSLAIGGTYAGTAAPTDGAIIQGSVAIGTSTASAGYVLTINGSALALGTGVWTPSDIQIKKDTSSFTDGLNMIKKIHPINFRYNGKAGITDTNQLCVSLVAQQLQAIAPYAVKPFFARLNNPNDTTETPTQLLSINAQPLIFACINAIKELAQNDSIKAGNIKAMQTTDSTMSAKLQTQDSTILAMQNQMTQCCENSTKSLSNTGSSQKVINDSLMKEIETLKKQMMQFSQSLEQCCFNYQQNTTALNSATKDNSLGNDVPKLEQNIPNPFNENTTIKYYVPSNVQTAIITVRTMDGKALRKFVIEEKGFGQIIISGGTLANGTYIYDMVADGKLVSSNKMVLTK